jgi:hypothetical protein
VHRLRFLTRRHAKMGHLLLVDLRLALDSMSSRASGDLTEGQITKMFYYVSFLRFSMGALENSQ